MFEGEPERDIYGNYAKAFELLKSKAIIPTEEEIEENFQSKEAQKNV
jgi:16S rRNA (cytosine1402-N4)-methyltransferase